MRRMSLLLMTLLLFAAARPAPRPGWLGVGYTFHHATEKGKPNWLHVQRLAPGGPAELAGLRVGDVVTAIDGKPLTFRDDGDALAYFRHIRPAVALRFLVTRRGSSQVVRVTPVPMPDEYYPLWLQNERLAAAKASRP